MEHTKEILLNLTIEYDWPKLWKEFLVSGVGKEKNEFGINDAACDQCVQNKQIQGHYELS